MSVFHCGQVYRQFRWIRVLYTLLGNTGGSGILPRFSVSLCCGAHSRSLATRILARSSYFGGG